MSNVYQELLSRYAKDVEKGLEYCMPNVPIAQSRLFDAMDYSLMAGGKRIRPVILLEFCRACGGDVNAAMPFACALEMIHTYSLIHDDLPSMDNDDLRRGQPTNHKVFGESTAILAGDALLTGAFEVMLDADLTGSLPHERTIKAAHKIAWAAGAYGMCGGQFLDMESENADIDTVLCIHKLKTGALFSAAAEAGCIIAGADDEKLLAAAKFANDIGLAFQLQDDILNVEGNSTVIGKSTGTDVINEKLTLLRLLGLEECKELVTELTNKAKAVLAVFPDNGFLLWIADMLSKRDF